MKLSKAIEILYEFNHDKALRLPADLRDALKLGTECMKQRQRVRKYSPAQPITYLPGETPE